MPSKKNKNYSLDTLKLALEAIRNGMPVKRASREFNIPKTTLHSKFHGKYAINCSAGAPTILTAEEEGTLVKWIISVSRVGFPVDRSQLLDSVRMLLLKKKRENPFKDNRPGRHWYEGFLRRHPEITRRMTQNLVHSRATLTEVQIRNWFKELEQYFHDNNLTEILYDPRRIYNADESAFFLCPKGKKVLAMKGCRTVYNHTANDEKECITTLITGNAAGDLPPPMVMFAYERIPQSIVALMPDKWGLGKSESGWMTGESFFEYVSNIFHPWLIRNNIPLPVIFYVDGHKSHLTMHLSNFCSDNGIILISLFPNATHMLQPMDVGVFHPLKNGWKNAVARFRVENNKQKIRKENFAPLLATTIKEVLNVRILQNAFRTCGLFPFNANAINYSKLVSADVSQPELADNDNYPSKTNEIIGFTEQHLKFIESFIEKQKLVEFETCLSKQEEWTGNIKDDNLYILWKKLKNTVNGNSINTHQEEQEIGNLPDNTLVLEGDWIEEILNASNQIEEVEMEIAETSVTSGIDENGSVSPTEYNAAVSNAEGQEKAKREQERGTSMHVNSSNFESVNECSEELPITNQAGMAEPRKHADPDQGMEKSPEQIEKTSTSSLPFQVPSPFKSILFWPENKRTENKKTTIVKVPSVATSEQWKAYYKKKQEAKEKKEEEKENRKRQRLEKLKNKQTKTNKSYLNKYHDGKTEEIATSSSETTNNTKSNKDRNFKVGDYVVVDYLDIKFPGVIEELQKGKAFVSVMTQSGNNWKWPLKKDILWYDFDEIYEKIEEPVLCNKRGIFTVGEMKKFQSV
ncbi:uncharacterized protein LOC123320469 [Coccinella septempunctata]|uniref:uncharacterized protein LOC123313384 n=2 Tax=Coccinella septempunctata TaxID=41139 RepID=UPI001D0993E8|nr:uncharacterized protein LOC123313384 [Coccinella septempunctata]XP_044759676.1 uncharacterized protein LOC123317291 [Coccinella septempunctata]XP_044760457.1 uncharacterized protein LOC123317906 [Coccinella septempunctata]XP_044763735.1 uncharacterized protein LOC123320469 [Coccinella septempunctata]